VELAAIVSVDVKGGFPEIGLKLPETPDAGTDTLKLTG
jgi:hypothetical protein